MAQMTDKEIQQFAKRAPKKRNATAYYEQAQEDVRQSGFRVTRRVKNILWRALADIQARAIAPSTVTVHEVAQMTSDNEKRHPRIIRDGHVMSWVRFCWVDDGEATINEKRSLPLVVEDCAP